MNHTRRGFLSMLPGLSALAHVPVLGWMFSREKAEGPKLINARARFMGSAGPGNAGLVDAAAGQWLCVKRDELPFIPSHKIGEIGESLQIIRWIPVQERLPECDRDRGDFMAFGIVARSRRVLVATADGAVHEMQRWLYTTGLETWTASGSPITHWAELPTPPARPEPLKFMGSPWSELGFGVPQMPSEPF